MNPQRNPFDLPPIPAPRPDSEDWFTAILTGGWLAILIWAVITLGARP